jgi:hypothetical protein
LDLDVRRILGYPRPSTSVWPHRPFWVDDSAPEQVTDIRRQGVDLTAVRGQGERIVLTIVDPVVAVEPLSEVCCLLFQPVGE